MVISYYKRWRLIEVNVNIIVANLAALAVASYPVYLTRLITDSHFLIVFGSFIIDTIVDTCVFAVIHIVSNYKHVHRFRLSTPLSKDIILLQKQRWILAPLFFFVATGSHYILLQHGMERTVAFIFAYFFAMLVNRTVHTWYGLRTGLFAPLPIRPKKRRQK